MFVLYTTECKITPEGREYIGTVHTTVNGTVCQAWSSKTPWDPRQYNLFTRNENFPKGSVKAAKNYCRNPDNSTGGPWCFTMDPTVRRAYCDIPLCTG